MASRKGGVLTLRMFAGRSKTGRQSLLAQTENIISGGFVEEPAWLQNMRSSPPAPPAALKGKPPKIEFPEDKYVDRYYKRLPNARFDPVNLLSAKPHYVQRYARRHWELIEEGMSEEEAREMLDKQIAEAQRRIDKATSRGKDEEEFDEEDVELASMTPSERTRQFIEAVQLEEEEVLDRMAYFRALQEAEEYGEYDEYAEDGEEYEEGEEEEEEEAEGAEGAEGAEEGEEASDEDDEKPTA